MDHTNPLGQAVAYPTTYSPDLLFPVARLLNREQMGLPDPLPFRGVDIWNAYELSWLEQGGKPRVAMAEIRVAAESANLIESKSLKLYLNSFNQTAFASPEAVTEVMQRDLAQVAEGDVAVELILPEQFPKCSLGEPEGHCLDELELTTDRYTRDATCLTHQSTRVEERLYSNLLRTNCPVTGQPDWATLLIDYAGPAIDHASLLRYIISFREHTGFHENCVEQIFMDLMERCAPETLCVYARFTRRGGIDINPWRSTDANADALDNLRVARQ